MPDSIEELKNLDALMRAERIDINDVRQHIDAVQVFAQVTASARLTDCFHSRPSLRHRTSVLQTMASHVRLPWPSHPCPFHERAHSFLLSLVQAEMAQVLSLCNFTEAKGDAESLPGDETESEASKPASDLQINSNFLQGDKIDSASDFASDISERNNEEEVENLLEGSLVAEARRLEARLGDQVRSLLALLDATSQHLRVVCRQVG